jgi:pimeloyl-ACP methyl ester carboxylesterase
LLSPSEAEDDLACPFNGAGLFPTPIIDPEIVMKSLIAAFAMAAALANANASESSKPTIVLVHGAFADTSSWNGVTKILQKDGYRVIAVAVPLRSVRGDAQYVADLVAGGDSPVVLVGHSYGGSVISAAGFGNQKVKALVFVSAFAPDLGETAVELSNKFPGSTLGPTLAPPVSLSNGDKDLYIQQDKFRAQFAADVSAGDAAVMAATQRPVAESTLNERSEEPAWKALPSWFVYGDRDFNIPLKSLAFMAERANSRETVTVKGASHVVMVSHPKVVAALIERAAASISNQP